MTAYRLLIITAGAFALGNALFILGIALTALLRG